MVFALGGANIDTLWQEAGEVPMAAMQNPMEEFAPYGVGILTEPVNNEPVIEAMGARETIRKATELGNNDIFEGLSTTLTDNWYGNGDGAANSAFAGHANYSGLFPIVTPEPPAETPCGPGQWGGSPWQWWDNTTYGPMGDAFNGLPAGTTVCLAMQDNPDMSEAKGLAFTDMIEEYMTPRINAAMSVDASEINVVLGCTDPNATNFDPFANTSDESCEFVVGPTEQNVNLPTGWCMFSTYMLNDNMSADAILSEIVDRVVIAKDYLGAAYLPEFNFNGIGDIQIGQGYQIKTTQGATLVVSGDYMEPEANPIQMLAGWNMIGYLRLDPAPADLVMADIVNQGLLVIAKDYLGAAYLPEFNFNGIGNLEAGRGYQAKVESDCQLDLLPNSDNYKLDQSLNVIPNKVKYFDLPVNTGSNMSIIIPEEAWTNKSPNRGDEIAVYSSDGKLVGSSVYSSPITFLSVWGDDKTSDDIDGLKDKESMKFYIWNKKFNYKKELIVKKWKIGNNSYTTDEVYQIESISTPEILSNINDFSIYPNPAKQDLNIVIELNEMENISIEIYNLVGKLISENNYNLNTGSNRINLILDNLDEGSYLCRIKTNSGILSKNFNIIK
jgi:hypothetical protein